MESIGYVPLGYPDRDLLGIGLPDSLNKSCQVGSKLHCLGGRRIFLGGVNVQSDYIRHHTVVADEPRLADLLLHQGEAGYVFDKQ